MGTEMEEGLLAAIAQGPEALVSEDLEPVVVGAVALAVDVAVEVLVSI